MPISQFLFSMAALGVSAFCGDKFLCARSQTILCSALAAAVAGGLILVLLPAGLYALPLSCLGPVSYTHLDVYKRQVLPLICVCHNNQTPPPVL